MLNNNKKIFLAIDANAIIHRAFHAYPPNLQTEEGIQVNAVYGFTTMLLAALERFHPEYVMCAMDTHKPTFRHEMYPDYKGTRKPTDQSLIDQFPYVEEVLKAFNIPILKKEGYEADDILGTISKYVSNGIWSDEDMDMYILSGDKDLLQLITDRVYVCLPNGNFKNVVVYDRDFTHEKYGFYPEQVVDYKGIVGDNSDNIPGIKGIGDKTALSMLSKYETLEGIYKNIEGIPPRYQKLLAEGIEQAEFSRQLATIETNMHLDIYLTDCILKDFDRKQLVSTFKKYSFKSLIPKLDDIFGLEEENKYTPQLDMFNAIPNQVNWSSKEEVIECVERSLDVRVVYINKEESFDDESYLIVKCVQPEGDKEFLVRTFDILKYIKGSAIFYNFEELVTISEIGVDIEYPKYVDIILFEHILNSERRSFKIKDFAFEYSTKVLDEKISPDKYLDILDVVEDTYIAQLNKAKDLELYMYTKDSIEKYLNTKEEYMFSSLTKVEMPISVILSKMESRGIMLDNNVLEKLREDLSDEVENVTGQIYDIVGHEFNINSPKQLSDILFKELDLPMISKGSTKESVLQNMKGLHPVIEKLLYYREITKILNTYVEPLYNNSDEDEAGNKVVHTDFKQTGTTSGRFSSVNPNMQNIPIGGEWANRVRECFVPRQGYKLIGMDYSQMELRIMADISQDRLLIKDFNNDIDIHSSTAARVLDKRVADVTSKDRSLGKVVNFGMIFGQTQFGLSRLLGIDKDTAAKYIKAYFDHYNGVEEYMRSVEKEAFKRGYVQSMFGTTRHISGIRSKNRRLQSAAAREAINMPIQGSEADIMKYVMIKIFELINSKYSKRAYMLLQIHDEIIFEAEESIAKEFSKEVLSIMKNSIKLEVPLEVHVSIGDRMSELK